MQKGIKNQLKIDAKSMQEKGMQKVWKMMPKGSQNESQNPSKIAKISEKKNMQKFIPNNDAETDLKSAILAAISIPRVDAGR